MVTASVETEGAEGTVSRIFSIPVIVAACRRAGAGAAPRRRQPPAPATN